MPRASKHMAVSVGDQLLDSPDSTMLDLLDRLLDKGVMTTGDVTLGVAGVDLIFLRLSALLCAADRLMPIRPAAARRRPSKRRRR